MPRSSAGAPKLPFAHHVGLRIDEPREGTGRCVVSIDEHHYNSAGIVHGGVLFTLADTAMGAALHSTLAPGESCATIEMKISYFKPVVAGAIVCTAEIVNKGRTIASLESSLHVDGVLVAKANGTFSIFRRKPEATT